MTLSRNQKVALVAGVAIAVAVAATILYYRYTLRGRGVIASVDIDVYEDPGLLEEIQEIDWGICYPGSNYSRLIYLKSVGNVNLTLGLEAVNWDPPEASVIGLTWDYDGRILEPGTSLSVTLTLMVPGELSGVQEFAFDIVITSASVE